MNASRASQILQSLASGIHPFDGAPLTKTELLSDPDIIRALFLGAAALDKTHLQNKNKKDTTLPSAAGKPWTDAEIESLKDEFNHGKSIKDMSDDHSRTQGAIRSRLTKLGLMDERGNDPR